MATQNCGYVACRCTRPYSKQTQAASYERVDPDGEFCSKRCRERAPDLARGNGGCLCGHPQCQRDSSAGILPMQ